jgi:hypothetical protein
MCDAIKLSPSICIEIDDGIIFWTVAYVILI